MKEELSEQDLKLYIQNSFKYDHYKQFEELKIQLEFIAKQEHKQKIFWETYLN